MKKLRLKRVKELARVQRAGKCPSSGSQGCLLILRASALPPPRCPSAQDPAALVNSVSTPQQWMETGGKSFSVNTSVTCNYKEMQSGEFPVLVIHSHSGKCWRCWHGGLQVTTKETLAAKPKDLMETLIGQCSAELEL